MNEQTYLIQLNKKLNSFNINSYLLLPMKDLLWGIVRFQIIGFILACIVILHNTFFIPFTNKLLTNPFLTFFFFGLLGSAFQFQGFNQSLYNQQCYYKEVRWSMKKIEDILKQFLKSRPTELHTLIFFRQENLLTQEQYILKKNEYINNNFFCGVSEFLVLVEYKDDLHLTDDDLETKKSAFLENNEPVHIMILNQLLELKIINNSEYENKSLRNKTAHKNMFVKNILITLAGFICVGIMMYFKTNK